LAWVMGHRLVAPTATTDITLMRARLTVTTGLTGLRAGCLSAPVRGMAGDARGVGAVGVMDAVGAMDVATVMDAALPAEASTADAALQVDVVSRAVRLAAFMAEVDSMVAAEASTAVVEGASTVAVVGTVVAVTGNCNRSWLGVRLAAWAASRFVFCGVASVTPLVL
jgi:hypothetical protein